MLIEKKNGQPILICDTCGKITSFKDMSEGGAGSWKFVPESDVSTEEESFRCKKCTESLGKITPYQRVVESICCGVY